MQEAAQKPMLTCGSGEGGLGGSKHDQRNILLPIHNVQRTVNRAVQKCGTEEMLRNCS